MLDVVPFSAFTTLVLLQVVSLGSVTPFNVFAARILTQVVSPGSVIPSALSQPWCSRRLVVLGVIPVNLIQPSARVRIASRSVAYASARLFIQAPAQHALAADAASRRARSGVFQRPYLLQCPCHQSVAAPLKRNPLGGSHQCGD